jgi:hypothetical protein
MNKFEIDSHSSILLLISTENCSVCQALDQRLKPWLRKNLNELEYCKVKLEDYPLLRGDLLVFSAPVLLLCQNGKEILRKAGVFSLEQTFVEIYRVMSNSNNFE